MEVVSWIYCEQGIRLICRETIDITVFTSLEEIFSCEWKVEKLLFMSEVQSRL